MSSEHLTPKNPISRTDNNQKSEVSEEVRDRLADVIASGQEQTLGLLSEFSVTNQRLSEQVELLKQQSAVLNDFVSNSAQVALELSGGQETMDTTTWSAVAKRVGGLKNELEAVKEKLAVEEEKNLVLRQENERLITHSLNLEGALNELSLKIKELMGSFSWRITKPLRGVSSCFRAKNKKK